MAQPYLHELVTCVRAPTVVLSGRDGQIRRGGAHGLLSADVRFLSELVLTVDGVEPTPIAADLLADGRCRFVAAVVGAGDPIADPTVRLERERQAVEGGCTERVRLVNASRRDVDVELAARLAVDFATVAAVKHGGLSPSVAPEAIPGPMAPGTARWRVGALGTDVTVTPAPATASTDDDDDSAAGEGSAVVLRWRLAVGSRSAAAITIAVALVDDRGGERFRAAPRPDWATSVEVASAAPHLAPLLRRSLDDLAALLLADATRPADTFAAAGSPWFMTLFGRDSIWAARFALPVGTELAAGTLRTLARRQARAADEATGAEPGKILHEVRTAPFVRAEGALPPLYYGTVDATPLWISLLHDAWCWGLAEAEVAELVGPLEAALGWVLGHAGGTGFLSYRDATGTGLANQGWKDSGDSIQDGRGTIATPPITLCEVQGYAHRALIDGARLLDALGRPGGERAREHAATLAVSFRDAFWVERDGVRFPAVALDADGHRVDSLTSNIGHLPASGILDAVEVAAVARLLGDRRLADGHGVRTLDADHPYFNPLGYHSGSIWPHDTAIAVDGLVRTGHGATAAPIAANLLAITGHFEHRLPELLGGGEVADAPLAYPAACRPQAWAAAAPLALLSAALGLVADVPAGTLRVRPDPAFASLFPLRTRGLRVMGRPLSIDVDGSGAVAVETDAPLAIVST